MSGLDRGVSRKEQLGKPYTSIDAASDADVLGTQTIDPYVGTALGTVREAYCAENSDIPESVEAALEFVERETNTKLCKQYMLTGKLAAACLSMLVRMAGARNVLEIGAYTGYSTIALASTGACRFQICPPCTVISSKWPSLGHGFLNFHGSAEPEFLLVTQLLVQPPRIT